MRFGRRITRSPSSLRRLPLVGSLQQSTPQRRPPVVHRGHRPRPPRGADGAGFPTLAAAAAMPMPIAFKPRAARATPTRASATRRACSIEQRTAGQPVHELLLPVVEGQGLARLPEPSPGDLFLDLEGARFAREGGREYLFGLWGRGGAPQLRSRQYAVSGRSRPLRSAPRSRRRSIASCDARRIPARTSTTSATTSRLPSSA